MKSRNLKGVLALVLAIMVFAMSVPAFADGETTTNPGTITINSPIMGAQYWAYKVFDLKMDDNANPTTFSYTISSSSPFFEAVKAYADMPTQEGATDNNTDGLTLIPAQDNNTIYNIHVTDDFDAQAFGKALEAKMAATYTEADKITVTEAETYEPNYEDTKSEVTVATSKAIEFDNLPLGYYLIISKYPETTSKVILRAGVEGDTEADPPVAAVEELAVTKNMTDAEKQAIINAYIAEEVTDAAVDAYIAANPDNFKDSEGNNIVPQKGSDLWNQVMDQLTESTKADAELKIAQALNQIAGSESDDNTQPLTSRLVFLDSTTTHADIIEKNETHKWDVPVNPTGEADLRDLPDHGEPEGGKNIVIKEGTFNETTKTWNPQPVYADWTEANIGDDVHYQLSVNAVNFERVEAKDENGNVIMENGHVKFEVKPIKEYVIADFENKNMTWNSDKGLYVTIVKKLANGDVQAISEPMDYTAWASAGHFFVNDSHIDKETGKQVFDYGGGIVIPWVDQITADEAKTAKNVIKNVTFKKGAEDTEGKHTTAPDKYFEDGGKYYAKIPVYVEANENTAADYIDSTTVPGKNLMLVDVTDSNGNITKQLMQKKDAQGNLLYELETEQYYASKYDNDVTILVDYYMTLNDTAIIDESGNVNISQYGVNYLDENDVTYNPDNENPPTPPTEEQKPDSRKEEDDAKVYTYALAIHKVDDEGKNLAGAKFKIKGLKVETKKADGWYKVKKLYTKNDETTVTVDENTFEYADELETDEKGYLIIEGLKTSQEVEIMETVAPAGYNKLESTIKANPKKTGGEVTTTSTVYYYSDAEKKIPTGKVETKMVEKINADGSVGVKEINITKYTYNMTSGEYEEASTETNISGNAAPSELDQTQLKPVEYKVVNRTGAELPATGGIGTTIFYVTGSILVLAAAILLITKRRMNVND